jgi:hypothetical protein
VQFLHEDGVRYTPKTLLDATWLLPEETTQPIKERTSAPLPPALRTNEAQRIIKIAVGMIDRSVEGELHPTRIKAGYLLGGYVADGMLTEDEARSALEDAVRNHTEDEVQACKDVNDGLAAGQKKPITAEKRRESRQAWREAHARNWRMHEQQHRAAGEVPAWRQK